MCDGMLEGATSFGIGSIARCVKVLVHSNILTPYWLLFRANVGSSLHGKEMGVACIYCN